MKYLMITMLLLMIGCGSDDGTDIIAIAPPMIEPVPIAKTLFDVWEFDYEDETYDFDFTGLELIEPVTILMQVTIDELFIARLNLSGLDITGLEDGQIFTCGYWIVFNTDIFLLDHAVNDDTPAHNACKMLDNVCDNDIIGSCNYDTWHLYTVEDDILTLTMYDGIIDIQEYIYQ